MLLTDAIVSVAETLPERPAVVDARGTTSYGRLLRLVATYAGHLRSTREDGCVGALCDPSAEFVATYLAAMATGRTLVPINERLPDSQLVRLLRDCNCTAILCQDSWEGRASRLSSLCSLPEAPVVLDALEAAGPEPDESLGDGRLRDRVVCFYTASVTGFPCGALLTHGNLVSTVEAMLDLAPMGEEDVFATAMPVWHPYGALLGCLLPLAAGARVIICPAASSECVARALEVHRPTFLVAPNTVISRLATLPHVDSGGRLRFAMCSGDTVSAEVHACFEERYHARVIEGYGVTEAAALTTCNPFGGDRRVGTVGRPLPNQTVRIADDHMNLAPVGDVGEIIIRGPNVMAGYLNRPEDTLAVLNEGWLHTGDLAWEDSDQFLHFVGRKRDLIVVDGLNVYPGHVETVLEGLEGILDACVIGVRDADVGEAPKAVLVVDESSAPSDEWILAQCGEHLAEYELPKAIARVPRLPRTTAGHISRATVAYLYGRSL